MDHEADGAHFEIGLRHIEVAFHLGIAAFAPGVLGLVELVAVLVLVEARQVHQVVIDRTEGLEILLTDFLRHDAVGENLLEFDGFLEVFRLRADGDTAVVIELTGGQVAVPGHGVAVLEGVVDDAHHVFEGNVPQEGVVPVVGNLERDLLVERMVAEARQFHIITHVVEAEHLGETLRGVGLAIVLEGFGNFAQIDVEQALDELLVFGAQVLEFDRHVGDAFQIGRHLTVVMARGVVVDAVIGALGYDAVFRDDLGGHMGDGTGVDVAFAAAEIVVEDALTVVVAYHEHFGEVVFALALAEEFRFKEGDRGEAPAGARAGLVLDRRGRDVFDWRKLVDGLRLREGGGAEDRGQREGKDAFHLFI